MADANILSYRVLFFEQDAASGMFVPPGDYPRPAMAVTGSHDLPTLRGWWKERDLELKEHLRLYTRPDEAADQHQLRQRDRARLIEALCREGLLAHDKEPDIASVAHAAHAYLARTPAMLAMAQIDDLTEEVDPVNVPATSTEHSNWRRRLGLTLEELARRPEFNDIAALFNAERGGTRGSNDHG
jgi:4-alpha-glucanotransferase